MMPMLLHLYRLNFAFLLTHELDAIKNAEWRLLYIFRNIPDATASTLFIALHVPLIVVLLGAFENKSEFLRLKSRGLLAAFMIIHAAIHYHLRLDPLNTFNSILSLCLIYGGAVIGLAYLLIAATIWQRTRNHSAK
jgi:hypothetical protein